MSETRTELNQAKGDFLLEIGTEELPARGLQELSINFAFAIEKGLGEAELTYGKTYIYATPRRLAVLIKDLIFEQKEREVEKRGPSLAQAFDEEGNPTLACIGFAKSCGVAVEELQRLKTPHGSWVLYKEQMKGNKTCDLLPNIINTALKDLPLKKVMRWGNGDSAFIRPVHWLVVLHANDVIDVEIFGLKSDRKTYGHRFLHPGTINISSPQDYEKILLEKGFVVADFDRRREMIRQKLSLTATPHQSPVIDEDLLEEVTGLVEWPVALLAKFDQRFLEMPLEVLAAIITHHQRCFYLVDDKGALRPNFIAICNIESKKPEEVIAGNERVMKARLTDAEFFLREDSKNKMEEYAERLRSVIFQDKLGTLYDKAQRLTGLAVHLAEYCKADKNKVKRASLLAKADLVTSMVREFPELQGTIGYHYVLNEGEEKDIAIAIKEHYLPKFSGDQLPASDLGITLALADRVDTLVGIFGIKQIPTGEKDPFGLRRAALAIEHIILEKNLDIDLKELLSKAAELYKENQITLPNKKVVDQLLDFFFERLRGIFLEKNVSSNVFNAVLARLPTNLLDFQERVQAVEKFLTLPGAAVLIAAHKRVNNILKKAPLPKGYKFDESLLENPAEQELFKELIDLEKITKPLLSEGFYSEALVVLAEIKPIVDDFFDKVMVMVDNEKLRLNRLALLSQLKDVLGKIAEISVLQ